MSTRPDAYEEFEATSLFCTRCRRAVSVRKKLLLVLPTGNKYDYICAECGASVGAKVDDNPTAFRETSWAANEASRRMRSRDPALNRRRRPR